MKTAAWVFGGILLVFIMAVVAYRLRDRDPRPIDPTTHNLLGFLAAVLSGLFAFFFTGSIALKIAPTAGELGSLSLEAAGGMALFVFVMWWWKSENSPIQKKDLRTLQALATALETIDRIYPGLRSIARPGAPAQKPYRVTAKRKQDSIEFIDTGRPTPIMTITAEDLDKLGEDDQKYIRSREKSMEAIVAEWEELYPKRLEGSQDEQSTKGKRLKLLATEACKDLNGILKHLGNLGYDLLDHYGAARSVCDEIQGKQLG